MKTVKLALNIGTTDAKRLGLDRTLAGETVSVSPEAAKELLLNGWATEPDSDHLDPAAKPIASSDLKTVPNANPSAVAVPKAPETPKAANGK